MTTVIAFENEVEIPADLRDLSDFRRWSHSESFPERGRIDYVDGRIEVDMSPEDLFLHGTPKMTIAYAIKSVVLQDDLGHVCVDSMRLVSDRGDLSVEPDVVFVSFESTDSGKVTLVRSSSPEGTFIEFCGAADLVVEVVSKSSTSKDLKLLPKAYYRAGVREYWIADVRRSSRFTIHRRGKRAFEAAAVDEDGFQPSTVLNRRFRFRRERHRKGHWEYYLDVESMTRK